MRFPIFANHVLFPSTTASVNIPVTVGSISASWTTSTSAVFRAYFPFRCKLSLFSVEIIGAPGAGKSWAFTLQKNGSNTALTVTISDTGTISSTGTESVIFEAGDYIYLNSTPTGTPTVMTSIRWSFIVDTLGRQEYFYFRNYGSPSTTAPSVGNPNSSGLGWSTTVTSVAHVVDMAHIGTVTQMIVNLSATPGAGKNYVFSILKNGVEEASSRVTIADAATNGSVSGLSIALAVGDQVRLYSVPTGTPTSLHAAVTTVIRPKINGEFNAPSVCYNPTGTATFWDRPFSCYSSPNTTAEDNTRHISPPNIRYYLKNFYTRVVTAPGAAKSYDLTVTKNGNDTAITCQISGTSKTASDTTHMVDFGPNDNVAMKCVPTGAPATTAGLSKAVVIYIPPATMRGNQ